jgi:hypothetical protein
MTLFLRASAHLLAVDDEQLAQALGFDRRVLQLERGHRRKINRVWVWCRAPLSSDSARARAVFVSIESSMLLRDSLVDGERGVARFHNQVRKRLALSQRPPTNGKKTLSKTS